MASDKDQRPPEVGDRLALVTRYMQSTCDKVQAQLTELVSEARLLKKIAHEVATRALECEAPDRAAAVHEFMGYSAAAIGHCQDVLARIEGRRREVLVVKVPVAVRKPPQPSVN